MSTAVAQSVRRWAAPAAVAVACTAAPQPAAGSTSEAAFPCPPISAPGYCGDDGPAVAAGLGAPTDVAVTPTGGYLVADATNNAIRSVEHGRITTVAGPGVSRASRRATRVQLRLPAGVAALADGSLLVADTGGNRVLRIHPGRRVRRMAGTGRAGRGADGRSAVRSALRRPLSVAPAPHGAVLVADTGNDRIRLVRADGTVTTVATLDRPVHVLATRDGGFVTATAGGEVLRVDRDGRITREAGPFAGAPAIALGADGLLRIADPATRRVVRLNGDRSTTTLVERHACGGAVRYPAGLAVTEANDLVIADSGARRILLAHNGDVSPVAGAGLQLPAGCTDAAERAGLLAQSLPPRGTPDHAYGPPGGGTGSRPSPPPRRFVGHCVPQSQWRFTLRLLYIRQSGRIVSRPKSRRAFRLYMYVSAQARLVLAARRAGHLRWRYPRRGSSAPRGGRLRVRVRPLPRGTYRLAVRAESKSLQQRICRTFRLSVRR